MVLQKKGGRGKFSLCECFIVKSRLGSEVPETTASLLALPQGVGGCLSWFLPTGRLGLVGSE